MNQYCYKPDCKEAYGNARSETLRLVAKESAAALRQQLGCHNEHVMKPVQPMIGEPTNCLFDKPRRSSEDGTAMRQLAAALPEAGTHEHSSGIITPQIDNTDSANAASAAQGGKIIIMEIPFR